MPELPEVETVRRHLERTIVGRTVDSVWTSGLALRKPVPSVFARRVRGRTIQTVRRHGKFLLLDLDEGSRIIAHLGMTGKFVFRAAAAAAANGKAAREPHTHVVLRFRDGSRLEFRDARRFGLVDWAPAGSGDERLGPTGGGLDPMSERLDAERMAKLFARCRGPIKQLLLDQKRIAGIGNIYASEALFLAGISPRRLVHTLTRDERARLAEHIHGVLDRAVVSRGTTFSDFRDLDDRPGEYASALLVYDREGEPCTVCATPIKRIVQAARSTYFCPTCQRKGGAGAARNRARSKAS
jgi:formamidopyrimidine-DNA glycosylase